MKDALNAPVVECIKVENYQGHVGDQIIVRATDDFKVAAVVVSIFNKEGDLIEEANAVVRNNEENYWLYKVQKVNPELAGSKITAVATDLPGNNGSLSLNF